MTIWEGEVAASAPVVVRVIEVERGDRHLSGSVDGVHKKDRPQTPA